LTQWKTAPCKRRSPVCQDLHTENAGGYHHRPVLLVAVGTSVTRSPPHRPVLDVIRALGSYLGYAKCCILGIEE
jgi:hypothetical protein